MSFSPGGFEHQFVLMFDCTTLRFVASSVGIPTPGLLSKESSNVLATPNPHNRQKGRRSRGGDAERARAPRTLPDAPALRALPTVYWRRGAVLSRGCIGISVSCSV